MKVFSDTYSICDTMERKYNNCHFCGGEVKEKNITVDYRGQQLFLVENVPTGLCVVCGEQYYKAQIVKESERLTLSGEKPVKTVEIPLWKMAVA